MAPSAAHGKRGEDLACRFLQSKRYTVVARNWRRHGSGVEVDIVAWEGETLACIEVKSRTSREFGTPDRAIGVEKHEHIAQAAFAYARMAGVDPALIRFDIVNVVLEPAPQLDLVRDAFRPARMLSYTRRVTE